MRKGAFSKKMLSVLLAGSMVVGSASVLSGCGTKKKNGVVKLDVYSQLANTQGMQTGWGADVLKEKFNVELNIIPDADGVYQTRAQKGDLGDIVIWGSDSKDYVDAVKNNLLLDWNEDDLLTDCGPYIKKHMSDALKKNSGLTKTITDGERDTTYGIGHSIATSSKDHDAFFAQGRTNIGTSTLGVDYIRFTGDENEAGTLNTGWHAGDDNAELLGASLNVPFNNFRVFGEYWKNTTTPSDYDTAWNAGLGYGHVNPKAPGTWQLDVAYNDVDRDVYFGGTGLTTGTLLAFSKDGATNVRFWNAMADVALEKNVVLHGEYAFAAKADNAADPSDSYSVTFNFLF